MSRVVDGLSGTFLLDRLFSLVWDVLLLVAFEATQAHGDGTRPKGRR